MLGIHNRHSDIIAIGAGIFPVILPGCGDGAVVIICANGHICRNRIAERSLRLRGHQGCPAGGFPVVSIPLKLHPMSGRDVQALQRNASALGSIGLRNMLGFSQNLRRDRRPFPFCVKGQPSGNGVLCKIPFGGASASRYHP